MKKSLEFALEDSDAFDVILLRQNRRQVNFVVDKLQDGDLRALRASHVGRRHFLSIIECDRVHVVLEVVLIFHHFAVQVPWPLGFVAPRGEHLGVFSKKVR